ncbi:MAG: peptidylprolyl isomerase, partial [Burkholderiales bacterium]
NCMLITSLRLLLILVTFSTHPAFSANVQGEKIIAHLNGQPIYQWEAEQALQALAKARHIPNPVTFDALSPNQKSLFIKQIAAEKLLNQAVKESNISKDKNIQAKLEQLKAAFLKEEFLLNKAQPAVTPEKVKAYYDKLVSELNGKQEVHLKHIQVDTLEEATNLHKQLIAKPNQFDAFAKKYSKDITAKNGGDMGFMLEDSLIKEFTDAIKPLKKSSFSAPIQTPVGWHIIKLIDRHKAKALPFEKAKPQIEQQLADQAIQEYIRSLVEKANLEIE